MHLMVDCSMYACLIDVVPVLDLEGSAAGNPLL